MLKEQTCWVDFSSDGKWEREPVFLFVFFLLCWCHYMLVRCRSTVCYLSPLNNFLFPPPLGISKATWSVYQIQASCLRVPRGLRKIWSYWNFTAMSQRHQQLNLQQPTCTSRPTASQVLHLFQIRASAGGNIRTLFVDSATLDCWSSTEDKYRDVKMPKLLFSKVRFSELKDLMQNVKRPKR